LERTINILHCDSQVRMIIAKAKKYLTIEINLNEPQNTFQEEILIVSLHSTKKEVTKIPQLLREMNFINPILILSFQSANTLKTNDELSNIIQMSGHYFLRLPFSISEFDNAIESVNVITFDELFEINNFFFEKRISQIIIELRHKGSKDVINKFFAPIRLTLINKMHNSITDNVVKSKIEKLKNSKVFESLIELKVEFKKLGIYPNIKFKNSLYFTQLENINSLLEELELKFEEKNITHLIQLIDNVTDSLFKLKEFNGT